MRRVKNIFSNIWHLITTGRVKTPREKLFDLAKREGYSSVHTIPKRYKGKKKYRKAPKIKT